MKRHKIKLITILLPLLFSGFLLAGEWQTFSELNTPRAGAASVVFNGKIYVLGGKSLNNTVLNTVECYDPQQGRWIENALPPFDEERYNAAAVVFNGKIYLIGGRGEEDVLDEVEVYDPVQNRWDSVQNIHEEREGHVVVILRNHIYVIGGQENEYEIAKKIEWYDATKDRWFEEKEKCPFPRVAQFGAAFGDVFYMFGGYYYGMSKDGYKWNAVGEHKGWENLPALAQARAYGATVVKGDSIFMIGGETSNGKTAVVEIFDVQSETLSVGEPLLTPRSGMTGVCLNDTIFVIGGYDPNTGTPLTRVDVYVETPTATESPLPNFLPSQVAIKGYPNPFNGQIALQVNLPGLALYRIDIYNLQGQKVKTLFNGMATGGTKHFTWQAQNDHGQTVSSGLYWLVVRSKEHQAAFKIIYTR